MLKQKMGAFLSLLDKTLTLKKSQDISRRGHLSTYSDGQGINSNDSCR
jgi:hypothetical protein